MFTSSGDGGATWGESKIVAKGDGDESSAWGPVLHCGEDDVLR